MVGLRRYDPAASRARYIRTFGTGYGIDSFMDSRTLSRSDLRTSLELWQQCWGMTASKDGGFRFIAKLARGEWLWFSSTKHVRGYDIIEMLWTSPPTPAEIEEVKPAFGDRWDGMILTLADVTIQGEGQAARQLRMTQDRLSLVEKAIRGELDHLIRPAND